VNLHCGRCRSDLEQSAVVFLHVNSSSVLVRKLGFIYRDFGAFVNLWNF
jgi:hypothetical protein